MCAVFTVAYISLFTDSTVSAASAPRLLEWSTNGNASDLNQGTGTPVYSKNGHTFFGWIDTSNNMKITHINPDGVSTTSTVWSGVAFDLFHVNPSVAIDKNGFVHITGDVHYDSWKYKISNSPYSITAGFRDGNPPGDKVTYPEFFTDKNGELYLAFRDQLKGSFSIGFVGGAVARYNTSNQSWTSLGGTSHGLRKTLVWENSGSFSGWYQKFGVRLYFDNANRMHLVATIAKNGDPNNSNTGLTHVIYAYSDDGGITFKKAGGGSINSLPLTSSNATVVLDRSFDKDVHFGAQVGAFDSTTPVVLFHYNESTRKVRKWNGTGWTTIYTPGEKSSVHSRRNGELVIFEGDYGIRRSNDQGNSWSNLPHDLSGYKGLFPMVDQPHYEETGNIRFLSYRGPNKMNLYRDVVGIVRIQNIAGGDWLYFDYNGSSSWGDAKMGPNAYSWSTSKWILEDSGDGWFYFKNTKKGSWLYADSDTDARLSPDRYGNSSKFRLIEVGTNLYEIENATSLKGLYDSNSTTDWGDAQLQPLLDQNKFKWRLK